MKLFSDPYERLQEPDRQTRAPEEPRTRRKNKYKKYRKNMGRALHYSWKCLMLGLQNFTVGYTAPLSAVMPDLQSGGVWG